MRLIKENVRRYIQLRMIRKRRQVDKRDSDYQNEVPENPETRTPNLEPSVLK
jgi:hypothetical protein